MENIDKFTGKATGYDRYRPDYPTAVYEFLIKDLKLTEKSVIADIGAGTGIFSMPLLEKGYTVYAVEPNEDMKRIYDEKASDKPNYIGVKAAAEQTTLPDNSVDLITVAQAFHWFDRAAFLSECRRILRPGGKVVLLWNVRDEEWGLTKELAELNKKYCPKFKGFTGGIKGGSTEQFNDFFLKGCEMKKFDNDLFYDDCRAFIGRCLSGSYAPKEGDENYEDYVAAVKELFYKHFEDHWIVIKHNTFVYFGEV